MIFHMCRLLSSIDQHSCTLDAISKLTHLHFDLENESDRDLAFYHIKATIRYLINLEINLEIT